MTTRIIINTTRAPSAVGTYSQAVLCDKTLYMSGQIGIDPVSYEMREGIEAQIEQVLDNLIAVLEAAEAHLADIIKLNVYLTDMEHFALINNAMSQRFNEPYPARAAVAVAALPKGALVEMEAVAVLP